MPAKYVYEPWKAPRKVQEEAGCIVGQDYPLPIVDHQVVHKVNIQRIKAAYDAQPNKGHGTGADVGSSGSKRPAGKAGGQGRKQPKLM